MSGPVPYLLLPGCARDALNRYAELFGGTLELHTFADFGRPDGPGSLIAHGILRGGPVALYAADAAAGERPFGVEGLLLALLGTTDPATLTRWFDGLADGGTVHEPLEARGWGAYDGQVTDRFGVRWLVGYEVSDGAE